MHAYLRGPDCKKKYEVSSKTHSDRMLVLLKYSTKLQGTASDLSQTKKLTVLLHSFPAAWINDYGKIHRGIHRCGDPPVITRFILRRVGRGAEIIAVVIEHKEILVEQGRFSEKW